MKHLKFTNLSPVLLFIFSPLFAFLFLIMIVAESCKNAGETVSNAMVAVPVLTVGPATTTTFEDYSAAIQGKTDVAIRSQVSGYLKEIYVDEGDYVHAGQVLFHIDEQPYRQQLNNTTASSHAAEAAVLAAQLEIDKLTPLVESKVISEVQLKTARATHKIALAHAEEAKAAVGGANITLGYTTIKAPASGYIGRLPFKKGSLISNADAMPLTTLSDVSEVHAYFSMSETEFILFSKQYPQTNMPLASLIMADGELYPTEGKVDMIDGQFDKSTGAITIRATFPNKDRLLRSGNTGKVRIEQRHADAILIPQQATVEMQDKVFVYVVDGKNKVSKQLISIGGKAGTSYIVKTGITSGNRIVSDGLDKLQEGAVIKPVATTQAITSR